MTAELRYNPEEFLAVRWFGLLDPNMGRFMAELAPLTP
jgi:hypothetical protein